MSEDLFGYNPKFAYSAAKCRWSVSILDSGQTTVFGAEFCSIVGPSVEADTPSAYMKAG